MRYEYKAVDSARKTTRGSISAEDLGEAIDQILGSGLTVVELTGQESRGKDLPFWQLEIGEKDLHRQKIPKKKLLSLLTQMALMMKAGVSLSMAMSVMIDGQKDRVLRRILEEMQQDLYSGVPISESMKKFRAFPELIVSMVQSGEENGRLDTAFERCASITEKEISLSSKIRGATGYPLFLLLLTVGLTIVMSTVVLPNFEEVFREFGADLPAITVAVMAFSNFLTTRWYAVLGAFLLLAVSFRLALRHVPRFALQVDRAKLRLPALGPVMLQQHISRFCRVMASLVSAGVDIVRSLEIARDIITNRYIRSRIARMIVEVKIGTSINASMSRDPIFDSLLVSMIRVGEESGMLADSLQKMADLYEEQTDASVKRLTAMLEPAMTIVIAAIVGTVILSIVVPMFGMYGVISG